MTIQPRSVGLQLLRQALDPSALSGGHAQNMTRQDVSPSILGGSVRVTLLGRGTLFLVVTLSLGPRNAGGGISGAG